MKFLAVLLLSVICVSATEYGTLFSTWATANNKVYNTDEYQIRAQIFQNNMKMIEEHNNAGHSWTLAMNQFGDLTPLEFQKKFLCAEIPKMHPFKRFMKKMRPFATISTSRTDPDEVDWTKIEGDVQPVKDQAACGSCWAFSATAATESANAIFAKNVVSLSEQQLVDCSQSYGNNGCGGGWMDYAFEYIKDKGLCKEDDYPYTAHDDTCKADKCTTAAHISSYTDVATNEDALKTAVIQQPIAVGVDANTWQFYSSGVLSNCGTSVDHGVLLVGYGTADSTAFWKIKNSWGKTWGEQGFIRIQKGTGGEGLCAIASHASYPTV